MRYNLLGRTGLYVSEICLGTMTFGGKGFWEQIGRVPIDGVTDMMKTAFDAGINFYDTANVYSLGLSEELTGEAIKKLGLPRDELVITTKVTGVMDETPNGRGQSRYHLMNSLDDSLRRLQLEHIDLYLLHGVDRLTPFDEALGTLNDMVRSGKVRYVGVCNMAAWQIMKLQGIAAQRNWSRLDVLQAYYTIAGRDLEREIVPVVEDQQMGVMVWSPLCGGLLTGKVQPRRHRARRCAPHRFRFPRGRQRPGVPVHRRDAPHRRGARGERGPGGDRLALGPRGCFDGDCRREDDRAVAGQHRRDQAGAER